MPNISLLDSLGRDPRYVLISSLDISLKRIYEYFLAFPETIVLKILKFWVHFVANIGKMVIEIIRRNATSNIYASVNFYQARVVYFQPHFGVISAECMNIIEIQIISLLDNTRYFIP